MNAVVIVEFSYKIPHAEIAAIASNFAGNVMPTVKGLIWKIFLDRPEADRSAGIYLFTDFAAAQAYVRGPVVAGLRKVPGISDVSSGAFEVLYEVSRRAGAPLPEVPEKRI